MSDRADAAGRHLKQNRVPYMVSTLIPLLMLLGAGFGFSSTIGTMMDARVDLHVTVDHALVLTLAAQLTRIERRQLAAYIRDLMIWQCLNTTDRSRDQDLTLAQDDYFALTASRLPEIDCDRVR